MLGTTLGTVARLTVVAGLALGILAAQAQAQVQVIYCEKPGDPKSVVPGARDLAGNPIAANWITLDEVVVDPTGRWILRAQNNLGSDLLWTVMQGTEVTGTLLLQEAQTLPGAAAGDVLDFVIGPLGAWDSEGNFGYKARARGGSTLQRVFVWNSTTNTFTNPFSQGTLITGLDDTGTPGDETFGNSITSVHLLDDDRIGSFDTTIGNISTSRRPAIMYDTAKFKQVNVDSVQTLLDPLVTIQLTDLSSNSGGFQTTPDGAHWMAVGEIGTGDTTIDEVLVRDGRVILQEGSTFGGEQLDDVLRYNLLQGGDWYARCDKLNGDDFLLRNGTLIAKTGDPIIPAASENWDNAFLAFTGNASGDYIIVGGSSGAAATNGVVVLNGTSVVLREGDPVDINGNGLFDDGAFIGRGNNTLSAFTPDSFTLTDDGVLYGIVNLRDNAVSGADLATTAPGAAFIRLNLGGTPCPLDLSGNDLVDADDIFAFLNFWFAGPPGGACSGCLADWNNDGLITADDIFAFLNSWFAFGPGLPCP